MYNPRPTPRCCSIYSATRMFLVPWSLHTLLGTLCLSVPSKKSNLGGVGHCWQLQLMRNKFLLLYAYIMNKGVYNFFPTIQHTLAHQSTRIPTQWHLYKTLITPQILKHPKPCDLVRNWLRY